MKYSEFVKSRFKDPEQTALEFVHIDPKPAAIHHAILGMVGEWFEFKFATDEANHREELGDFLFYFEALSLQLAVEPPALGFNDNANFSHMACAESMLVVEQCLGEMLDASKKQIIYRKKIADEIFAEQMGKLWEPLNLLICYHRYKLADLQAENVAKLTKRYPVGYTNKAANERADKA